MTKFTLCLYDGSQSVAWDSVVIRSKNGNFMFLRDYIDYHAHRFNERSLIVFKKGTPVAVFPCNRVEDQVISHGGLTYGGLIYGRDLHALEVLEIFRNIVVFYRALDIRTMVYKAVPHVFHNYPAEEDLYALFRLRAKLIRRDLSAVIHMGDRLKLSELRKRATSKAKKNHVEIQEGLFFEEFHEILTGALLKFAVTPVHSLEELRLLKGRFPDRMNLFGAFRDKQLLAGALVYDFGHIAHTQYLASSAEGKAVGALDLLLGYLLDDVFSQRQYFSFGISTKDQGYQLNEGLVTQKEGFGGRAIVHDFYEVEL